MATNMIAITAEVKEHARQLGARIVGVGTSDRWLNAPKGRRPQDFMPQAKAVLGACRP